MLSNLLPTPAPSLQLQQRCDQLDKENASLREELTRLKEDFGRTLTHYEARKEIETLKIALSHTLASEQRVKESLDAVRQELRLAKEKYDQDRREWQRQRRAALVDKILLRKLWSKHYPVPNCDPPLEPLSAISSSTGAAEEGAVGIVYNGAAIDTRPIQDIVKELKTSPIFHDLNTSFDEELSDLSNSVHQLQRTYDAALRKKHARSLRLSVASSTSSTSSPCEPSPRSLQLLIALWDTNRAEGVSDRVASLVKATTKPTTFTCAVCITDLQQSDGVRVEGCGHVVCKRCITRHITTKLDTGTWPIHCPQCVWKTGEKPPACTFSSPSVRLNAREIDALPQWFLGSSWMS